MATVFGALIWGVDEAKDVFVGAMVAFLPNAYFAWSLTRAERSAPAAAVLEAGKTLGRWGVKVVLTLVLLVLAIGVARMGSLAFLVGLGVALLAPIAVTLVLRRSDSEANEN